MKKIAIIFEENNQQLFGALAEQAIEAARELDMEPVYFPLKGRADIGTYERLRKMDADYLLSFDMAGFEMGTLTEDSAYNLLYAKQIHILFQNHQKYRTYLRQDLAMNLFLFIGDEYLFKRYKQEYSHILNLEAMPSLVYGEKLTKEQQEKNRKAIKWVMERVYQEVETAGSFKDRLFETSDLSVLDS